MRPAEERNSRDALAGDGAARIRHSEIFAQKAVMREAGRNSKPPHAADVRLARRREGERLAEQYGIDAGIADPLQPEHAGMDAAEM